MKILVINCGSSSIKFVCFEIDREEALASGKVERIGERDAKLSYDGPARVRREFACPDHHKAMAVIGECLTSGETAVVADTAEISAVGHRVVHGLDEFVDSVRIDASVIATIEQYQYLAPLHNPPNLAGIRAAQDLFPQAEHVAVFDTAFHQTMPKRAFMYAIPYELYGEHKIRKYGFHGTNHRYCAMKAAEMLGKPAGEFSGVTCHLGNGCSLAAVKDGKSIDTTMGLTPLEGVPMGTRSGDIDPAVIFMLDRQFGMEMDEIDNMLNKKSGFLGLSGISNDLRPVEEAMMKGNPRAQLAIDVFAYRVKKYIGAYHAVIGRLDAVVFTGGIGERSPICREAICRDLEHLGIVLDQAENEKTIAKLAQIQAPGGQVKLLVIPANEELMIARDTHRIVTQAR